jgi:PAS domain-containing protein
MDRPAETSKQERFYRTVLDAIPSPVFIVTTDVRIIDFNAAAAGMLKENPELLIRRKAGEVLHCVHSREVPEGCGSAAQCKDCVVRISVGLALSGRKVTRQRMRMELVEGQTVTPLHLLVTAAPFENAEQPLVLVILEDISEIEELRGLLPICAWCKKVRDDDNYWHQLEAYLEKRLDVRLSHGICPECAKKHPALVDD